MDRRKRAGDYGEAAAEGFLRGKGHAILQRKYIAAGGEVDIITKDGETLVFVEVKHRKAAVLGAPVQAVTSAKQQRIAKAAMQYLAEIGDMDAMCRFDVVEVVGREMLEINHIVDAFWV